MGHNHPFSLLTVDTQHNSHELAITTVGTTNSTISLMVETSTEKPQKMANQSSTNLILHFLCLNPTTHFPGQTTREKKKPKKKRKEKQRQYNMQNKTLTPTNCSAPPPLSPEPFLSRSLQMKKKQQKSPQPPPATLAATATATDLKSLIRDHSLFFDKLIELIPAKFYLPNDDAKPWFQGLNKSAKEAVKKQTRENIKKARRDRLDPEKSQTSTLELLKQSIDNEKQADKSKLDVDEDEQDQDDIKPITSLDGHDRSVTYEELRQRLHRRIEELRANRGSGERSKNEKREKKEYQVNQQKKRKRGTEGEEEKSGRDGKGDNIGKSEGEIEKEVTEATKGIEFGKVKLGGEEESGRKKKRKLSKVKELERAKMLVEAKKDPEKGEVVAKKHSWKAAVSRAAGVKVHDDPKLLKQSMQKEKRKHEKNVEKWNERVGSREKVKEEKQQKRAGNIAERIHQKKMRKIAKREKKLMRPGFEGRKEGYINEN